MQLTIEQLNAFFQDHPEEIGNIEVETQFGYYPIDACGITAFNSNIIQIITETDKHIETSPDHLLWSKNGWTKTRIFQPGDQIKTDVGWETIKSVLWLDIKEDLYDIQVREKKEFYANGFVSHNSTFIDALCFALFGKAYREINLPLLINSVNEKDLVVEIEFESKGSSYMVRRGLNPRIFEIYRDGEILDQQAKSKDSQDILENNILNMNYRTFTQIVILGSSSFVPFMKLPLNARRLVIEDLLDIQVFTTMNKILKRWVNENRDAISRNTGEIRITNERISFHERHIQDITGQFEKKQTTIGDEIKKVHQKIADIQTEIKSISLEIAKKMKEVEGIDQLIKEKDRLESLEVGIRQRERNINKTIKLVSSENTCPPCDQTISDAKSILERKQKQLEEITAGLVRMEEVQAAVQEKLNQKQSIQKEITVKQQSIQELNYKVRSQQSTITSLQSQKQELIEESEKHHEYKIALDDLVAEKAKLERDQDQYESMLRDYDVAAEFLCDTGVKSKIVQFYLPVMNRLINRYLESMGFGIRFELDENFNEKIRSRYRDVFSYHSFSEGEKFRIDIALLLSWREIARLKNSVNTNLLVMDEIFDSSLDDQGTEDFTTLLKEIGQENNVFVISHKIDTLRDKFDTVLLFKKQKDFSKLQEAK